MLWQLPRYEEIKMDAEIGSYQADEGTPPYFVLPLSAVAVQAVAEAGRSSDCTASAESDTDTCST